MKRETIALHGGYTPEETTKSVAVPIFKPLLMRLIVRSMVQTYST